MNVKNAENNLHHGDGFIQTLLCKEEFYTFNKFIKKKKIEMHNFSLKTQRGYGGGGMGLGRGEKKIV